MLGCKRPVHWLLSAHDIAYHHAISRGLCSPTDRYATLTFCQTRSCKVKQVLTRSSNVKQHQGGAMVRLEAFEDSMQSLQPHCAYKPVTIRPPKIRLSLTIAQPHSDSWRHMTSQSNTIVLVVASLCCHGDSHKWISLLTMVNNNIWVFNLPRNICWRCRFKALLFSYSCWYLQISVSDGYLVDLCYFLIKNAW